MKYNIHLIIAGLSFLAFTNSFGQPKELTVYKSCFDNELKSWTQSFKHFNLSTFKKSDTLHFENIDYMDARKLKEFYSVYKPALTFSKDSTQFIDIYSYCLNLEREGKRIVSYGGEAEQSITLCNLRTRKWERILFLGLSERIDEVAWVTNSKFILVGTRMDDNNSFSPIIYIGDTKRQLFFSFISIDSLLVPSIGDYDSPKLKKLNIKQE